MRGSAKPRQISTLRSVPPSSTMISSKSVKVWASTEWIAAATKRSTLNTGITTLTAGAGGFMVMAVTG